MSIRDFKVSLMGSYTINATECWVVYRQALILALDVLDEGLVDYCAVWIMGLHWLHTTRKILARLSHFEHFSVSFLLSLLFVSSYGLILLDSQSEVAIKRPRWFEQMSCSKWEKRARIFHVVAPILFSLIFWPIWWKHIVAIHLVIKGTTRAIWM